MYYPPIFDNNNKLYYNTKPNIPYKQIVQSIKIMLNNILLVNEYILFLLKVYEYDINNQKSFAEIKIKTNVVFCLGKFRKPLKKFVKALKLWADQDVSSTFGIST